MAWCDKNFACSIKTSEKNFCAVSEKSVNQISQLDMVYLTSTYSCFAISVKWKVTFRRYAEIIYISACWGVEFYGFWAKRVADSAKDRYFLRLDNKQKRSETCSCYGNYFCFSNDVTKFHMGWKFIEIFKSTAFPT